MSAQAQMRAMLDQLMGTGRDGEFNRLCFHFHTMFVTARGPPIPQTHDGYLANSGMQRQLSGERVLLAKVSACSSKVAKLANVQSAEEQASKLG